jgi:hypothetical protein
LKDNIAQEYKPGELVPPQSGVSGPGDRCEGLRYRRRDIARGDSQTGRVNRQAAAPNGAVEDIGAAREQVEAV